MSGEPLVVALARTDDFAAAVLSGTGDREALPARLRDEGTPACTRMADLAEADLHHIERDPVRMVPPDATELGRAYWALRKLHGAAFDWQPPDVPGLERLGATRMRQYVRAWINEWDLVRLDPRHRPQTEVVALAGDYQGPPELDRPDLDDQAT